MTKKYKSVTAPFHAPASALSFHLSSRSDLKNYCHNNIYNHLIFIFILIHLYIIHSYEHYCNILSTYLIFMYTCAVYPILLTTSSRERQRDRILQRICPNLNRMYTLFVRYRTAFDNILVGGLLKYVHNVI